MKDMDCEGVDRGVCPYCGFVNYDDEARMDCTQEGESTIADCASCGKEFTVTLTGWSLYWLSEKGTNNDKSI